MRSFGHADKFGNLFIPEVAAERQGQVIAGSTSSVPLQKKQDPCADRLKLLTASYYYLKT